MKGMLIKELAGLLNISTRAIRFYEEKGIIQPQKHPDNQYRLFSDSDARRLQTVISLREIGIPIEEIKLILLELDKGKRDDALYALELQRAMMFAQLAELKNNIEMTDSIIGQLKANQALDWQHIFDLTKGLKKLRDWFWRNGYKTVCKRIGDLLQVVYAEPI
ncbi:MerR family transcriptional regulator [Paenibacillus sp. y28]|uniref:MerR family transcriptional regulator n=1 Tax=Paenibacillus sp. y28 TaxID=3129110 RepID=UPI003016D82F